MEEFHIWEKRLETAFHYAESVNKKFVEVNVEDLKQSLLFISRSRQRVRVAEEKLRALGSNNMRED